MLRGFVLFYFLKLSYRLDGEKEKKMANYVEINGIVSSIKGGTIHTLTYEKNLKTRKGVNDIVTKTVTTQVMLKVKYDNIRVVKEARSSGKLPVENQGLPKGTSWLDDRHIFIKSDKTGAVQLRCMKANGNKPVVEYRKNGVLVEKAEVEPLCLKSEFPVYKDDFIKSPIFNIGIDKIVRLK